MLTREYLYPLIGRITIPRRTIFLRTWAIYVRNELPWHRCDCKLLIPTLYYSHPHIYQTGRKDEFFRENRLYR